MLPDPGIKNFMTQTICVINFQIRSELHGKYIGNRHGCNEIVDGSG
jgi:hypothetical protein